MKRLVAPRAALVLPAAILAALALLAASTAHASAWSPVGPPGGAAYGLAVDPKDANVLYAGAFGGGVWKSADGGASWTVALPRETARSIATGPDGLVLEGTNGDGVLRSKDGGKTWTRIGGEPPHPDVVALALESPRCLLVGFEGGGVWRLDGTPSSFPSAVTKPK